MRMDNMCNISQQLIQMLFHYNSNYIFQDEYDEPVGCIPCIPGCIPCNRYIDVLYYPFHMYWQLEHSGNVYSLTKPTAYHSFYYTACFQVKLISLAFSIPWRHSAQITVGDWNTWYLQSWSWMGDGRDKGWFTHHAVPLPFSDSTLSFVKVPYLVHEVLLISPSRNYLLLNCHSLCAVNYTSTYVLAPKW
jgi:hypothetical protein